jgi:hypothetical protein
MWIMLGVPFVWSEEDFPILQELVVRSVGTTGDFDLAAGTGPEVEMVASLGKPL